MHEASVVEELALHLVVSGQPSVPMSVELRYETSDPYAVHASFRADESHVTWVLSRELLMTGLQAEAGLGDVKVRPHAEDPQNVVLIELSSPDGTAVLSASASDLRGFLLRTCDQVPPGAEADHLDLDLKLAQLLA